MSTEKRIVVLQRGWVAVGDFSQDAAMIDVEAKGYRLRGDGYGYGY